MGRLFGLQQPLRHPHRRLQIGKFRDLRNHLEMPDDIFLVEPSVSLAQGVRLLFVALGSGLYFAI